MISVRGNNRWSRRDNEPNLLAPAGKSQPSDLVTQQIGRIWKELALFEALNR